MLPEGLLQYRNKSGGGVILVKNNFVPKAATCTFALLWVLFSFSSRAEDLLLFPSLTSVHQTQQDAELPTKQLVPAIDIFYTHDFEQTRFLAEFLKSSQEADLERLQFGWHILPGKTLWAGRFHNPISFWNTQMHHGDFLQTSLSRPTVANYEDELGPLPTHISGVLLESTRTVGDAEIDYMADLGVGPSFVDTQLEPLDLLNPVNTGKVAGSFRLGFHPEVGNPNQFGAALGYAQIPFTNALTDPVNNVLVNEVEQTVLSTYLNYEQGKFHLIGELFFFDDLVSGTASSSRYISASGYLQPEYKPGESGRTTLYARLESTPNAAEDGYLSLFKEFSPHQYFAGVRYDITAKQAVKLEAGRTERQDGLKFNSISVQWCMVLPL
jgi:hypothetical protein